MQVYLFLTGIIGTLSSLGEVVKEKGSLLIVFPTIDLVLALGCLCLGIFLKHLLTVSPRRVLQFFLTAAAWLLLVIVVSLIAGVGFQGGPLVGFIVALYLWSNARRLAAELRKPETQSANAAKVPITPDSSTQK
jgi:hypothetical protein